MVEEDLFIGPPPESNFSYGYAKRCLAVQIDAYNKQFGTKYNYLIPCNLYGDYDNMHDESKMHRKIIPGDYLRTLRFIIFRRRHRARSCV